MSDPVNWPLTPRAGLHFAEMNDQPRSPISEFRDDGSRIVRTLLLWPHEDQVNIPFAYLGYPEVRVSGTTRYLSRVLPDSHPEWRNIANKSFLYATQIMSMEGYGLPERDEDGSMLTKSFVDTPLYLYTKAVILYESLPYKIKADAEVLNGGVPDEALLKRYVSFRTSTTTENLPLPKETFQGTKLPAETDPTPVPGAFAGVRVSNSNISITWWRVPEEAIGLKTIITDFVQPSYPIDACRGCVNSVTFAGWRPGTLLFLGENATPCESSLGMRLYNLVYDFKGIDMGTDANSVPIGHNHLLFRDGKWRELTKTGLTSNFAAKANDVNPFNWFDFHLLFRPPA